MKTRNNISDKTREEAVVSQWVRLGVLFNVPAAGETPDLERILLETVRLASRNSRLLIMAATWLTYYSDYVAKRRLAVLIEEELEEIYRPVMGFLLEWVQGHLPRKEQRFGEALRLCRWATEPGPLLEISRRNKAFVELARENASGLSRKWGCWIEELTLKENALRSLEWIARENPALAVRAITGGDLVATLAAEAEHGRVEFSSESELARRFGASRAAVRAALRKLKLAGWAHQVTQGKARAIQLWNTGAGIATGA